MAANRNLEETIVHLEMERASFFLRPREQLEQLEAEFLKQQYLVGSERLDLAATLQLTETQVRENRRTLIEEKRKTTQYSPNSKEGRSNAQKQRKIDRFCQPIPSTVSRASSPLPLLDSCKALALFGDSWNGICRRRPKRAG
ncbi:Homeobox protein notochord, partial [Ophiophagus hannah]